jgi:hypothetical protein
MRLSHVLGLVILVGCGGRLGASSTDGGVGGNGGKGGPAGAGDASADQAGSTPPQQTASKVDILFMLDNSPSMAEKQEIFEVTLPDLLNRLINPDCVDSAGAVVGSSTDGQCASGTILFAPVADMHLGIVSSSLGGMSSDACPEPSPNPVNPAVDTHNNDYGELINRSDPMNTQTETPLPDAAGNGDNFLAWFPSVSTSSGQPTPPVTRIGNVGQLTTDFRDLISGVHEFGCGFEAQDESWYRFLIQPDPYDHVSRDMGECSSLPAGGPTTGEIGDQACLVGINRTILQQRHDFLRPDSLVLVVMLTDENSGEVVDPLSVDAQGWAYMQSNLNGGFPGSGSYAFSGTSACGPTPIIGPNPGPTSPGCTSCGFDGNADDPNCRMNGGVLTAATDDLNLRGVYDLQRFGVDPRYPVSRYANGLASPKVPDRTGEHQNGVYVGASNCVSPLFAANLPTDPGPPAAGGSYPALCNLTPGTRNSSLVFLAAITGVPHQLLQAKPGDPECPAGTAAADCPQKKTLSAADWQSMLGADPENYDFTGIDPHMFVSVLPRTGAPANLSPPNGMNNTDPINGREWYTENENQQFACIFPLAAPRDCSVGAYAAGNACDCTASRCGTGVGASATASPGCASGFDAPSCECPPLCGDGVSVSFTTQVNAKVYPSPREIEEVKALGAQGVLSSMCPIHPTDEQMGGDPLFGYRPAVQAILDHVKEALAAP